MGVRGSVGEGAALPRGLLAVGVPLAGIVLVTFFIYLGFPYDELLANLAGRARASGSADITFRDAGPHLSLFGPGVEARGVRVASGDGAPREFEVVRLRPAWSAAWLRGEKAVHAELEGASGVAEGTVVLGEHPAWEGELIGVDLTALPLDALASLALTGVVDATFDVSTRENGLEGSIEFEAKGGTLRFPDLPMPVPYDSLTGEIALGGAQTAEVKALTLTGPLLDAEVTGTIGRGQRLEMAPLKLEARIDAQGGAIAGLQAAGLRPNRNGKIRVRVVGTVSRPKFR